MLVQGDVNDPQNTGIGMRVNYGYKPENIFRTAVKDVCDADDFAKVNNKADGDGNTIAVAMISKSLLDRIRKTRWARELAADYKEQVYSDASKLPVPSVKTFTEAFESEFGYGFIIVNRSILCEKNGKDVPVKPFNPNRIVFLPNADTDGSLVHGTLAEMTHPAKNVIYSTIEDYKLISRLRVTEPSFAEVTKGQAMVLPVIEDVDAVALGMLVYAVGVIDQHSTLLHSRTELVEALLVEGDYNVICVEHRRRDTLIAENDCDIGCAATLFRAI